jgi:hypothetical protein
LDAKPSTAGTSGRPMKLFASSADNRILGALSGPYYKSSKKKHVRLSHPGAS